MPEPTPNAGAFKRAVLLAALTGVGRLTYGLEVETMATLGHGLDPRRVPLWAKRGMSTHPEVYKSVRAMTGTVRRSDLYSFVHDDDDMQEEAEAALWRILPVLLGAAARAYDYGCSVTIFNIGRESLFMSSTNNRRRTVYVSAFEVAPDEVVPILGPDGKVEAITYNGQTFPRERFHIWTWDPEFGELVGQGARDRAWRDYCEDLILSLLENKYLERSVDPTRLVKAPSGPIVVDEKKVEAIDYALELVTGTRGGGTLALPSEADEKGNPFYDVKAMDLPDRSEVWTHAIERRRASIRSAYLHVSGTPSVDAAQVSDVDGQHREFVDDIATWAAENITEILEVLHGFNYDPQEVPAPCARTSDVGKANARRTLKELLALANAAPDREIARRMDVPAALDKLGAPIRDDDEAPDAPPTDGSGQGPGRPRDGIGPRQDRREKRKDPEAGEPDGPPGDGTPAKSESPRARRRRWLEEMADHIAKIDAGLLPGADENERLRRLIKKLAQERKAAGLAPIPGHDPETGLPLDGSAGT